MMRASVVLALAPFVLGAQQQRPSLEEYSVDAGQADPDSR